MTLNCFIVLYFSPNFMSKSIALSLLAQGQTGEQILQILNTIAEQM
jgi:hypothetical protein